MLLRKLVNCILLFCILIQTMSQAIVFIDYYTNTDAYAKNCENKALLQLHCNGKCQMMKKLQEQEKRENQALEKKTAMFELWSPVNEAEPMPFASTLVRVYGHFLAGSIRQISVDHFHPPGIV